MNTSSLETKNIVVHFKDQSQLQKALTYFDLTPFKEESVLLKLHMGEIKNKFFVRPEFVKSIIKQLKNIPCSPFLYDTTVLYNSQRKTIEGYKKVASLHGFSEQSVDASLIIDDTGISAEVQGYQFDVGKTMYASQYIVCLSHVKGHIATGMGGAIKNLGMGGVTKESKKMMHHGSRPNYSDDNCTHCGICSEVCPFDAITINENSWNIDKKTCFGCGVCVENCPTEALSYTKDNLQYLLACSTKACVQNKQVIYINDVNRISDSCDCDSYAKEIICPDIGYLISTDSVAIDHASLKLIDKIRKDVFEKTHHVDPYKQVEYAEKIGLGSQSYELISIS